jgi:hypothetical protein
MINRSANFMHGLEKDPFASPFTEYKEGLKTVGKAIPGIVGNAIKNEADIAVSNPGNYVQRLGGHAFNVVADVGEAAVNSVGSLGNSAATFTQNRGQDVLAGAVNWAGSVAGYNPRIDGSSKYKDINPIPRVTAPKVDTTPGNKVWKGGDAQYRPAVGTLQSGGAYVPDDPIESVNRSFELVGTALLPFGGVVTKPVTTAAKGAAVTTAKGAAKGAKATGKVVAKGTAAAAATPAGQAAAKATAAAADVVSGATKAAVQGAGKKVIVPVATGSLLLSGTGIPAKASVKPAISAAQAIKKAERATDDTRVTFKLPERDSKPSSVPDAAGERLKADLGVDDIKYDKAKHILDTLAKADSIAPAVFEYNAPASGNASAGGPVTEKPTPKPKPKPKPKPRPGSGIDLDINLGRQDVKLQRIS